MKQKGGSKRNYGLYFLLVVILLYLVLYLFIPQETLESAIASGELLLRIAPILLLVVVFMGIVNYVVTPHKISTYVGKDSGAKGWMLAAATGIISHGPIYAWYPLLKDLREQGMRDGLIAVFLYNRAIKIPLLPVMIYYFGWPFVVLLTVYMLIASIAGGKLVEELVEELSGG
ncbi:MAG: permease [Archaeoglobaceae archaeon]